MIYIVGLFRDFWNGLAQENGKLKFRTQREAAEFVRRVQNENGGPNAKIVEMRRQYEAVNRAKSAPQARLGSGGNSAVH